MARIAFAIGVLLIGLVGCSHAPDPAPKTTAASQTKASDAADPLEAEREGMHQGAFQLGNAVQDLQTSIVAAKNLQNVTKNASLKAALSDVLDGLDDAGSSIADFSVEPPDLESFGKQEISLQKKAKDAVNGANDALHDIDDAYGALEEFLANPPTGEADLLGKLDDALDAATEDLKEAITGFGGKVEEDDTEPVTPDVNQDDKSNSKGDVKDDSVKPDS